VLFKLISTKLNQIHCLVSLGERGAARTMTYKRNSGALNAQEAADLLNAHVETVRRLARRGEIPSFKLGKDWRFRKEALFHWADGQQASRAPGLVLIVDDDESICRALVRIVECLGCRAQSANDGRCGLEIVSRNSPDLILLDLAMPGMSGPQFLKELRKTQPNLPVVILTGYPDGDLMMQAMAYGPLMLLAKPVDAAQVQKLVTMLIGERRGTNARVEAGALTP